MRHPYLSGLSLFLILSLAARSSAVGTAFLTVPYTPREMALGGSTTSLYGDPSLARGNPALIVQSLPAMDVHFGYNVWFAGSRGSSLLIAVPGFGGTVGLGVRHLEVPDLELRTTTPTDDYLALFKDSGTTVEVTWGKRFDRWQLGGTVRLIRLESYIESSSGMGADLGAWWPLVRNRISLGLAVRNLGYMTPLREEEPALPTAVHVGGTWIVSSGTESEATEFRSLIVGGAEFSKSYGTVARIAGELSIDLATVTIGLRQSRRVSEVAAGFSVEFRRFRLSYGASVASHELGIPHLFHLRTRLP